MHKYFNFLFNKNKKVVAKLIKKHRSHLYNFPLDRILTFTRYAFNNHESLYSDLYIAHGVRALAAANMISSLHKKDYIYDAIEIPSLYHRNLPLKWHPTILNTIEQLNENYLKKAKKIVTVGYSLGKYLTQYDVPIHVIPNYRIDSSSTFNMSCHKKCLHELCKINKEKSLVLILSTVTSNIENLIFSLNQLPKHVHFIFLGKVKPNSYKVAVQKLARENNLHERCHWLEPIPYNNLIDTISCADVGLIVLDKERLNSYLSLPNRLFDYFAASIPIISPDIPDISFYLRKHKCGIILDNLQPSSWAQAISSMLNTLSYYKGNMANLNKIYRWKVCEPILLELIGNVKSVTILSMNDLVSNQRVNRIATTLAAQGILTKIFCLSESKTTYSHPNIQYHLLEKF
ncbi:glycosyltransferase [Legionella sp. CNM-1927-20]|uniref:glycosyltransferase n=1 Tax=Legionella sp. CNM-1927-20 TaxID=3422221 RepID=UPI00403ABAFB